MPGAAPGLTRLAVSLALLSSSCHDKQPSGPPPAAPVVVAQAVLRSMPLMFRGIGSVEPTHTVSVRAQVTGQLSKVHFEEGQDVAQSDLLFTIDPRPFQAALREAEATLARDVAQANNARKHAERLERLVGPGVVSRDQYEQAIADERAARASLAAGKARVATARLQLSYCWIRSPIAGRTGRIMVHPGNLVQANGDTPLVVINRLHPIFVSFTLPEQALPAIQTYAQQGPLLVTAVTAAEAGPSNQGEVTFIDNAVDRSTGTIRLKASFPNKDDRLWPGAFVDVAVTLTHRPDTLVVPSQAVQQGQPGTYVFVVGPDHKAELRLVQAADSFEGQTVIESGLRAGERVVTDGQMRLRPGAAVAIREPQAGR